MSFFAVLPGGAGQKAGVLSGDTLAKLDGKSTQDMDFETVKHLLGAGVNNSASTGTTST